MDSENMVSPCGISQGSQQKSGLDRRRVFLPLLVPQRDHRIDPRGAMGRQITGSERDHPQHACHDSHYDGIVSFEAEEQRPNSRPSTTHRQHHPAHLRAREIRRSQETRKTSNTQIGTRCSRLRSERGPSRRTHGRRQRGSRNSFCGPRFHSTPQRTTLQCAQPTPCFP